MTYIYLWIMSLYDPKFDLKIKVGHSDLYSQASDFALYLEKIPCINNILLEYPSMSSDFSPENKCRSQWPIFHSPVILP